MEVKYAHPGNRASIEDTESIKKKTMTVGFIFAVDIVCLVIFGALLGWI
jgi:F0F1-type ATP synthase assembly protein I